MSARRIFDNARQVTRPVGTVPPAHPGGTEAAARCYPGENRLQFWADEIASGRRAALDRLGAQDPKLLAIMSLLDDEAVSDEPASRLIVEQLIDLLCLQLMRSDASIESLRPERPRGLAPWQIKRVTAYMRKHLAEDIGLQQLADLVKLSRFHFCTAFRMATRRTPHEWLARLRIQEAQRLLSNPSTPVTEIALAVGYQTPSGFTAAFRRLVGVTPREFRRRP